MAHNRRLLIQIEDDGREAEVSDSETIGEVIPNIEQNLNVLQDQQDHQDEQLLTPLEQTDLERALEASLEIEEGGIIADLENFGTYQQFNERRLEFANFQRTGYEYESVEHEIPGGDTPRSRCEMCQCFPSHMQYCGLCDHAFCFNCVQRMKEYRHIRCYGQDYNGQITPDQITPTHQITTTPEELQNNYNEALITCNYGCGEEMSYLNAESHHTEPYLCPLRLCPHCLLFKHQHHSILHNCLEEIKKFSYYIELKKRESERAKDRIIKEKEEKLKEKEEEIEKKINTYTHQKRKDDERIKQISIEIVRLRNTNLRLSQTNTHRTSQEAEQMLQSERELIQTRIELERIQERMRLQQQQRIRAPQMRNFITHSTDNSEGRNPRPTVYVNSQEFGPTRIHQDISSEHQSWDRLIEMALTQFGMPSDQARNEAQNYEFFDVRTHVRYGPEQMRGQLRNGHSLNLLPRGTITPGAPFYIQMNQASDIFTPTVTNQDPHNRELPALDPGHPWNPRAINNDETYRQSPVRTLGLPWNSRNNINEHRRQPSATITRTAQQSVPQREDRENPRDHPYNREHQHRHHSRSNDQSHVDREYSTRRSQSIERRQQALQDRRHRNDRDYNHQRNNRHRRPDKSPNNRRN